MSRRSSDVTATVDWVTVFIYMALVLIGWVNIYAAVFQPDAPTSIFSIDLNSGKQLMWIGGALLLALFIMLSNFRTFDTFGYVIYGVTLIALVGVLAVGHNAGGNQAWFKLGFIRIQPSEFAKFGLAIAVAKYLGNESVRVDKLKGYLSALALVGVPAALVLLQKDTGSAMVFSAFVLVLYREGLPAIYMVFGLLFVALFVLALFLDLQAISIVVGVLSILTLLMVRKNIKNILSIAVVAAAAIAFVASFNFILHDVLKPHQRKRIEVLVNTDIDPLGVGYQVTQSKIAIGSGGLIGKGFLKGTQTKFNFVPEQSTDFIFCTIGEEWGWVGSVGVFVLFGWLIFRIIRMAERQNSRFARVYGYSVACIFFLHYMINIGMTIGIFPVIGIPLPFVSYGGSSLWSFTILLFIFLKLDAHRSEIMARRA